MVRQVVITAPSAIHPLYFSRIASPTSRISHVPLSSQHNKRGENKFGKHKAKQMRFRFMILFFHSNISSVATVLLQQYTPY